MLIEPMYVFASGVVRVMVYTVALMGVAARVLEGGTDLKERQCIVVRYVYCYYVVCYLLVRSAFTGISCLCSNSRTAPLLEVLELDFEFKNRQTDDVAGEIVFSLTLYSMINADQPRVFLHVTLVIFRLLISRPRFLHSAAPSRKTVCLFYMSQYLALYIWRGRLELTGVVVLAETMVHCI
jgi:hypothetical protein